jgi:hypothetical protein
MEITVPGGDDACRLRRRVDDDDCQLLSLILVGSFVELAGLSGMSASEKRLHIGASASVLVVVFAIFGSGFIGGGNAKLAAATLAASRSPVGLSALCFVRSAEAIADLIQFPSIVMPYMLARRQ